MELYYKNPAKCWLEGFPLGNGRMGAVIHGALDHEVLQLNEDTLWSGSPYSGQTGLSPEVVKQARELARAGKYEEAKLDDVSLSMETFVKTLPPIYVMVDMLQELYENVEEDNSRIDILEEAVRYGIYVLVTSEFKVKKMTRSKFIEMLLASREVLILGNIKDQLLFSYTGVREENRKVEFGYYHNAGVNRKVKLIFHREMK